MKLSLEQFVRAHDLGALNTIPTACKVLGMGKTKLYERAKAGKIRLIKDEATTRITSEELHRIYCEMTEAA